MALLLAAGVSWLHGRGGPTGLAAARSGQVRVLVARHDLAAGARMSATDVRMVAVPPDLVPAGAVRQISAVSGRTASGPVRRGEILTDTRFIGPGLAAGLSRTESAAVPVRLADPDAVALLRPGDVVDILAAPAEDDLVAGTQDSSTTPVTTAAPTLPSHGTTRDANPSTANPTGTPPAGYTSTASAGSTDPDGTDAGAPPPAGVPVATLLASRVRVLAVVPRSGSASAAGGLIVVAVSPTTARVLSAAAARSQLTVTMRPP